MVFPPIWREKWRRSEHAHTSDPGLFFSLARVQSLYGGWKKGEFMDWTKHRGTIMSYFKEKVYVCDRLDFSPSMFEWAWMMREAKVKTNHVATFKKRWLCRDFIG